MNTLSIFQTLKTIIVDQKKTEADKQKINADLDKIEADEQKAKELINNNYCS